MAEIITTNITSDGLINHPRNYSKGYENLFRFKNLKWPASLVLSLLCQGIDACEEAVDQAIDTVQNNPEVVTYTDEGGSRSKARFNLYNYEIPTFPATLNVTDRNGAGNIYEIEIRVQSTNPSSGNAFLKIRAVTRNVNVTLFCNRGEIYSGELSTNEAIGRNVLIDQNWEIICDAGV
jgi:hypothetical protein